MSHLHLHHRDKAHLYSTALDQCRRSSLFHLPNPVDRHAKPYSPTSPSTREGLPWSELVRKFLKHTDRKLTAQAALLDLAIHTYTHNPSALQPAISELSSTLSASSSPSSQYPEDVTSAKTLLAYGLLVSGDHPSKDAEISKLLSSSSTNTTSSPSLPALDRCEPYDLTLRVLSHVIQARLCQERADQQGTNAAYARAASTYHATLRLLASSISDPKIDLQLHELGQEALSHACRTTSSALDSPSPSSSTEEAAAAAVVAHKQYFQHSHLFPPNPKRELSLRNSFRKALLTLGPKSSSSSSPDEWQSDISSNNLAQESILRQTTTLPHASQTNQPYLTFLDQVALGWRKTGSTPEGAKQVVEIMYRALTHTFRSHRLLRYLVHALTSVGRYEEAGQSLKLYVLLVNKARETDAAQVAKDLTSHRPSQNNNTTTTTAITNGEKEIVASPPAVNVNQEVDVDSDRDFVETLLFGSRLCCKYLNDPVQALNLAKMASQVSSNLNTSDTLLHSRIEGALGVAFGALQLSSSPTETDEHDQQHRKYEFKKNTIAAQHLAKAAELNPSSWRALYEYAYQLAENRDVALAVDVARRAAEATLSSSSPSPSSPTTQPSSSSSDHTGGDREVVYNKDVWHLLALLLAAQKDFSAALQVCETAIHSDDDDEEGDVDANREESGTTNGYTPKPSSLLSNRSASYLDPYDYPTNEPASKLRSELEIRITKNVLIELLEGPDAALFDQQSLFAYFREAFGKLALVAPSASSSGSVVPSRNGPVQQQLPVNGSSPRRASSLLHRTKPSRQTLITSDNNSINNPAPSNTGTISSDNNDGRLTAPSSTDVSSTSPLENTPTSNNNDDEARTTNTYMPSTSQTKTSTPFSLSSSSSRETLEAHPEALKLLTDIWLLSAASYRRAGKLDDARGAIQEAELLNPDDPDVWYQFALYNKANGTTDLVRKCVQKALAFEPTHPPSLVQLAKLYLDESREPAIAKGLLHGSMTSASTPLTPHTHTANAATSGSTTTTTTTATATIEDINPTTHRNPSSCIDVPEAWFELSKCYKQTREPTNERACLVRALYLQETRSVRTWSCLPRVL